MFAICEGGGYFEFNDRVAVQEQTDASDEQACGT